MLTIEETRKHLPEDCKDKPDEEVRKIMDDIQGLTELALEILQDDLKKEKEAFEGMVAHVGPRFELDINGDHGIMHWRRVKRIGLHLAAGTAADWCVITLFSALHDICRQNEYSDPDHGIRAAEYVKTLHTEGHLQIKDNQLKQLEYACRHHNDRNAKSDDLTIQTCWDADRLDLYRTGEIPNPKYLYTALAKDQKTMDFAVKLYENTR